MERESSCENSKAITKMYMIKLENAVMEEMRKGEKFDLITIIKVQYTTVGAVNE